MSQIQVRFSVSSRQEIKGTIVKAPEGFHTNKIVFIVGYKPEKAATWVGLLPKNQETWICMVVEESMPDVPDKGVVFVRLLEKGTTVPAQFVWLPDIVFDADSIHVNNGGGSDYTTTNFRSPVFSIGEYNIVSGTFVRGAVITATPQQETKIRETLKAIADYRDCYPSGADPVIAMVFHGMTPAEAYTKIKNDQQRESVEAGERWLRKQEGLFGQYLCASNGYKYGRIAFLTGARIDERNNRYQIVQIVESGKTENLLNTDRNWILSKELVEWAMEVARIAIQQPIPVTLPEGYSDYSGIVTSIPFPTMPTFRPVGGEYQDHIKSIRILYGTTPQVRIETEWTGFVIGGNHGEGFTEGSISLNPNNINPAGRALVTKKGPPPYLTVIPANVIKPQLLWYEAESNIRFGWGNGVTRFPQTTQITRASVKTFGSFRPDGLFVYEWDIKCPYEIPAEPGAAQKIAQKWAAEFNGDSGEIDLK